MFTEGVIWQSILPDAGLFVFATVLLGGNMLVVSELSELYREQRETGAKRFLQVWSTSDEWYRFIVFKLIFIFC